MAGPLRSPGDVIKDADGKVVQGDRIRLAIFSPCTGKGPKLFGAIELLPCNPRHLFSALAGYNEEPNYRTETGICCRSVLPDSFKLIVGEPALPWRDRRRRLHTFRRTALEIASADGPAKHASDHCEDISPWTPTTARTEAERLLILVAQGRDPVEADILRRREAVDLAFSNYADLFGNSVRGEGWTKMVKRSLRLHVKPILKNKPLPQITRSDIAAVLDAMPVSQIAQRRSVPTNCISPRSSLTTAHPVLDDVGDGSRFGEFGPEPFGIEVPYKADVVLGHQRIDGPLCDFSFRQLGASRLACRVITG